MTIIVYVGLPGSGKSLRAAQKSLELLERNKRFDEKTGIVRKLHSNIKFSPHIEDRYRKYIAYWTDPEQLIKIRDGDVIFDEIATYIDSTQWANMPLEFKRWLQQHRKFGVDIYGTAQDFGSVDKSMRRLTNEVYVMRKLIGSRDKSATMPEVKRIWGIVLMRQVDPDSFADEKQEYKFIWTDWFFIRKKLIEAYDTTQEIEPGKYPALRHIVRTCNHEGCGFRKVVHT